MAYADFAFYKASYYGEALTDETTAARWLDRASDEIDALTFGRLTFAMPTVEAHVLKVKKAVCAVAEALFYIDIQSKAAMAQKAEDGTYRGAVASISSGRESISFSGNSATASAYAAAAASEGARRYLIDSIAVKYLANIPDAAGVNLLYAGEVRHVRQHDHPV